MPTYIPRSTIPQVPLRIFAVFFHPAASVTAKGGAERRFIETFKIISKRKNTKIAVLEPTPSLLDKSGIVCTKYLMTSGFRGKGWLGAYFEWILWVAKTLLKSPSIIHREKPNVVFVPNNTLPNMLSGFAMRLMFNLPTCVVVHHVDTPFAIDPTKNGSLYDSYRSIGYTRSVSLVKLLGHHIVTPLLRKAKTVIAVSNFTAGTLTNMRVDDTKVHVSGNAVDTNLINSVKPHSASKAFDGVFVGRIAKEKGVFDLLKAWRIVVESRKKARLLIVGSGLELPALKKKIESAGLEENVHVRGRCSDRMLYSILKSSRVFLFPTFLEGWGIAPAEALACGVPVVAYAIPALREIFGGCKSVFLVPVGRADRMAQATLETLTLGSGRLHKAAVIFAGGFSWDRVASADLDAIAATAIANVHN